MKNWELQLSKSIFKDLGKVESNYLLKIKNIINDLALNLFPENAKKLKGKYKLILRIRVGVYRIVYLVNLKQRLVVILGINHRKSSYRKNFNTS